MTERPCIRCEHTVRLEDGQLVYCSNCGAPQIFLSEQLQAELAEGVRTYKEHSIAAEAQGSAEGLDEVRPRERTLRAPVHAREVWALGTQYALLSASIALALGLLSLALPPVSLLLMVWILCAPMLTVTVFNARINAPLSSADASSFAARLGLLTGLLVTLCSAIVFTLNLVLSRFVLHDAATLDAQLAATFAQQRAVVLARLGAEAKPTLDMFAIPEFRVGLMLSVLGMSALLYLLLSAVAGAVAGLVLRRRRA